MASFTPIEVTQIIERNLPQVRRMAGQTASMFLNMVEPEDLVQVGLLGLMKALERYEEQEGSLDGYLMVRAKGAMMDEIRSLDHVPRTLRQLKKQIEQTRRKLEQALSQKPTEAQVANKLNISVEDLRKAESAILNASIVSFDEMEDEDGTSAIDIISAQSINILNDEETEQRERMSALIKQLLPPRNQMLMRLYYEIGMTLREIAGVLGVNESRAQQLHSESLKVLKESM